MPEKQETFKIIQEQYLNNKTISETDMKRLEVILQTPDLDPHLRNEIIDFISDMYLEQDDYQAAHDIVNQTVKKSRLDSVYLLYAKLSYIRLEAMLYGKDISVKTTNKVQDNYQSLKRNAIIIIRDFEKNSKILDENQLQRIQFFFSKMMYAIETIDGKPLEINKTDSKVVQHSEQPVVETDTSLGENDSGLLQPEGDKKEEQGDIMRIDNEEKIADDGSQSVTAVDVQPKQSSGTQTIYSSDKEELENVKSQISALEETLSTQSSKPKYLNTMLLLIELGYSAIMIADKISANLNRELQEYEEIAATRTVGLSLVGGESKLNEIIDNKKREIESLEREITVAKRKYEERIGETRDILERG